ncbi:hypothetical protein ACWDWO_13580 [Actinopolymorpha singaporensis]|uniref:Uncharacterized protein n=1 Tax=Actinopolymorpha singaporensis TaxID=117157 RepID=A0A1H1UZM6_9ACTN|nr:hypothetical protein [Actinopolymorpha singaporensis]SDS77994.1 hypothetical protein SAMN04489717_3843 [Actinopolymorpha singaporensis]
MTDHQPWRAVDHLSRRVAVAIYGLVLGVVLASCAAGGPDGAGTTAADTPKPAPTVTVTATPEPAPTVTVTVTMTPEPAPTVTVTAKASIQPTAPRAKSAPKPLPARPKVTHRPTRTTSPRPAPPPEPASCYPRSNSGNCYRPGQYCRNSDHGRTGVAENGEAIRCQDDNGWRWESI